MSQKFNGAVTATGTSLIAEAVANNTKMKFLKIVGSTTKYTNEQLAALTDDSLASASHNQDGHVSNVTIKDKDTIATELVLDGNSVGADYQLNSVLILATIDGTDHLFGVLGANQPQYMNAYDGNSATNLEIHCSFKVANAEHVDITVNSAGTLTVADYNRLQAYTDSAATKGSQQAQTYADSQTAVTRMQATSAVAKEAAMRSMADNSLATKLASEASARTTTDSAESAKRESADNAISAVASAATVNLSAEVIARSQAVASEGAIRADADNSLASKLASEASARTAALSAEAIQRGNADKSISAVASAATVNLSAETLARSTADSAESAARAKADDNEAAVRSNADKSLTAAISAEASNRSNAIGANSAATSAVAASLAAETNTRAKADADEVAARKAADSAEASTRAKADSDLFTRVGTAQQTANDANANANTRMLDYQVIPANADLNDYIKPGFYGNSMNVITKTMKNVPTDQAFSMIVNKAAGATQLLCEYMPVNAKIWYRSLYDGTGEWGAWHEIIQADQSTTVTGQYTFTNQFGLKIVNANQPGIVLNAGQGEKKVLYSVGGNNQSGDGLAVGAGGLTVLGGGEAAGTYLSDVKNGTLPSSLTNPSAVDAEIAVVASDSTVILVANLQNNDANAREARFSTAGDFTIPGVFYQGAEAVATQDYVRGAIDTNESTAVKDTRAVNNPPSWYFENYPLHVLTEFKQLASIGVTAAMLPPSQTSTYGLLTTKVPFQDSGGGFPVQEVDITQSARPAKLIRKGISTSAWSAWELMTTYG